MRSAADSSKPGRLFAGTNNGAWRSEDEGKTWTRLGPGIPEGVAEAIAINPKNSAEILLAVNTWVPGKQYVGALLRSDDGGKSWKQLGGGMPETRITALAVDPVNPRFVYAGTEKGVFSTNDGGTSWAAFGGELNTPEVGALALSTKAPARIFAGTRGSGVVETTLAR